MATESSAGRSLLLRCPDSMARLTDLRRPFSGPEAWLYDVVLAEGIFGVARPLVEEIAAFLAAGDRVLDVGCGGGQELLALAQARPEAQVVGVDLSKVGPRRAVGRAGRSMVENAAVGRACALALPFRRDAFTASVSFFSIKHWPDPRAGIAELVRVTAPGGWLLVAEINPRASPDEWRRYVDLTRVPVPLRGLYTHITFPTVVRRSLDYPTLEAAFAGLPVEGLVIEVGGDLPYLVARAHVAS